MENLQINKDGENYRVAIYFTEDDMATMGSYSTKAKAIKVLDEIQDKYLICPYNEVDGIPYSAPFPKVFQTPSNEEVEG
jgi:hypothetical protein